MQILEYQPYWDIGRGKQGRRSISELRPPASGSVSAALRPRLKPPGPADLWGTCGASRGGEEVQPLPCNPQLAKEL